MPSLRRSFSSPSVRSSPYPTSLSGANPSSTRMRTTGQQPRRSSGSATSERRVLADIEWWRVYDGQCDFDLQDQGLDDAQIQDVDVPVGGTVTLSAGGGSLEPLQTPLPLHSFSLERPIPLDEFAVLSIAPYSPQGSRHGRDSSVESTPELATAPLESVTFGLASPSSCYSSHHVPIPASLTRVATPLFGLRSISLPASGFSHSGSAAPEFGDMGGDSFSLSQNLFH